MMTFELDQISFLYSNEGTFLLGRVQVSLTFWEENQNEYEKHHPYKRLKVCINQAQKTGLIKISF